MIRRTRSRVKEKERPALIVNPDRSDLLTAHFDIALASPNEETAFQTALKVLRGSEVDAELARSLVTRALDAKQFSLAHRMANVLLSRRASDSLGYILKGAVLLRQNKSRQAMDYFEKASSMGSQEPELFYEIAVLYRKLGKNGRAIDSLKHALELNPGSAACARELGSVLFAEGRFEAARAAYQKALKIAPSDTLAAIGAGECHLRLGRTGDARDTFERVLAIDPGNAAAKRWLAVAAAGHKPERETASGSRINDSVLGAAAIPEKAAEPLAPAGSSSDESAAGSQEQADQSRGYVDSFPKTEGTHPATVPEKRVPAAPPVDRSPDDERLRKAQKAQRNGDLASAEQICRLVLAEKPDHAPALNQLALIYKGRKETQKAIDTMELARRSAPGDAAILLELGQLYTETSQTGPAIRRLEEHIRLDPSSLAGHYSLGVNYERAKVYARAEREYRTILSLYPQFHEAHDYLGNLYFSQRRFKLAAGEYEKLARSKPAEPKPRFKMAVALFYQNDRNRARQEFQELSRGLPAGDSLRPKVLGYLGKL
jgi:tetratricopeptide (TPR) repeat protein